MPPSSDPKSTPQSAKHDLPEGPHQPNYYPDAPPPRRSRAWRYSLVVFWMVVIFLGSTSLGRPENSEKIVDPVLAFLGFKNVDDAHIVVRKMAHVAEYSVFAMLLSYFCLTSSRPKLRRWWFAFALLGLFLFACSDEYHQTFVAERVGQFKDVELDTAAGAAILLIIAAARRVLRLRAD